MISMEETKDFLRVAFPDDDKLIERLILTAYEYLQSAVGQNFNRESERAKLLALVVVKDLYDNRGMSDKEGANVRRLIADFSQQLRLEIEQKET